MVSVTTCAGGSVRLPVVGLVSSYELWGALSRFAGDSVVLSVFVHCGTLFVLVSVGGCSWG